MTSDGPVNSLARSGRGSFSAFAVALLGPLATSIAYTKTLSDRDSMLFLESAKDILRSHLLWLLRCVVFSVGVFATLTRFERFFSRPLLLKRDTSSGIRQTRALRAVADHVRAILPPTFPCGAFSVDL